MDAGTHLRAIWRRRWFVLAGALLVTGVVFALRAAATPTWTTTATLYVVAGGTEGRDITRDLQRLAVTYGDFGDDQAVLTAAAGDLPGVSAEEVQRATTVTPSDDGQVVVTATAADAAGAANLANAVARALSAAADREQAAALERELAPLDEELASVAGELTDDPNSTQLLSRQEALFQTRLSRLGDPRARLDIVSPASAADAVRAPTPVRDAGFAGVLALIVLGELAALAAARRGGIEGGDPVPVLRAWTGLPAFRIAGADARGDQATAVLLHMASRRPPHAPVVIALAPLAPVTEVREVVRSLLETGTVLHGQTTLVDLRLDGGGEDGEGLADRVHVVREPHVDLAAVGEGGSPDPPEHRLTLVVADRWDDPDLLIISRATGAETLLVVDGRTARRREVREAVETMRPLRTEPAAVIVVDAGRGRRGRGRRSHPMHPPAHVSVDVPPPVATGGPDFLGPPPSAPDVRPDLAEPSAGVPAPAPGLPERPVRGRHLAVEEDAAGGEDGLRERWSRAAPAGAAPPPAAVQHEQLETPDGATAESGPRSLDGPVPVRSGWPTHPPASADGRATGWPSQAPPAEAPLGEQGRP